MARPIRNERYRLVFNSYAESVVFLVSSLIGWRSTDLDNDDPVTLYLRELATAPPLTKEEEVHLFHESVQTGELAETAKRRLLESRLPLVVPIAERYAHRGLTILDLIQEGNLGLMRALENFPESGLDDFSAYASSCIEDAISGALVRSQSTR